MDEIQPGTGRLCDGCIHLLQSLRDQGHPFPCRAVRWDKGHHLTPGLTSGDNGEYCREFVLETPVLAMQWPEIVAGETYPL
jgi:hypothetical protein